MAADLEQATRIAGSEGRYSTTLSDQWAIWGPNGGYLAAIALRAAGELAAIRKPCSFYCHFLSSPEFAQVELEASALKQGRRAESFAVSMAQAGRPVLHALVKTTAEGPGYLHQHPSMPSVQQPEGVEPYEYLSDSGEQVFRFWENVERRPVRVAGEERDAPVVREWVRFRPVARFDDPFVDAARALILLDTFGFPAAYRRYRSWEYLAPNLDTSVWWHRFEPNSEWLLIEHECAVAAHGLMGVSGRVWSEDGKLLASGAAQLCCVPGGDRRG